MGLSHAAIAPYDAYPTADGQILIGVQNDRGWRTLVNDVFGHPEYVGDPRFARNVDRVAHRDECDAVVAACTKAWTTADLDGRLAEVGIPAAQINSTTEVLEHPQLAERDRWRPVDTEVGAIRGILPPMTFRDVELPMGRVPALGEHTEAIRAELQRRAGDDAVAASLEP
jgi:formyl-CoA transferase